ncbi:DNA-(apurinic or apyrimidinic site) lyase [Echinococcus granulosus]|uniref:exodeoxyribonuclease III n=1 Tax=Echinococcus granulosus TaxID=6210 RepID=W6VBI1_ECHGR|nr:DNA-(apurinic or apyrimidinic site) lyase [Echinococcus granulosus]EUB64184.1 DNA-(apurinic or apyrimidinic site) lyase [Echinococcus granulosus]
MFLKVAALALNKQVPLGIKGRMLEVCSWNVNGIRSFAKPFKSHLDMLNADIIRLQETKAGNYSRVAGYDAYFSACKKRPGYSGVCVFCREPLRPVQAYDGLRDKHIEIDNDLDAEGRGVIVQFETEIYGKLLSIINVYRPRVDPEDEGRAKYRERFLKLLEFVISKLIADGSLPHPIRPEAFTCWNLRNGAGKTNYGTRIDYIFYDKELANLLPTCEATADIMPEVEGSDHCPVWAVLPLTLPANANLPLPPLCSHFWPQCQKRQLLLLSFLKKDEETGVFIEVTVDGRVNPLSDAHKCRRLKQTRLDFCHGEPCVCHRVKPKSSQHRGHEFWVCARPVGAPDNLLARCNTFIWK